jgi:N6-adenosine-specific RNA methylase IME4
MGAILDRIRSAWSDALRPAAAGHRARSPNGEDGLAAAGSVWPFEGITPGSAGCILADPPWQFNSLWGGRPKKTPAGYPSRAIDAHYPTMSIKEICALPVGALAAENCVLFLWATWPIMPRALEVIEAWGFTYKTCAFSWMKGDPYRLFADDKTPNAGMGYWTRANTEPCLLATRGRPKRIHADVRQGIIAPRREHSRKPDCVHDRIERLVGGPYVELFARASRPGWWAWGNEVGKFDA